MTDKQVRDYDKFMLRLPEGMREAIAELAKRNGRSMNAEVVQILKDALTKSSFELIASKDELKAMPLSLRSMLINQRTKIARIKVAQAMREIEENIELLAEPDVPMSEYDKDRFKSYTLYYDKEAADRAKEFNKLDSNNDDKPRNKKPT